MTRQGSFSAKALLLVAWGLVAAPAQAQDVIVIDALDRMLEADWTETTWVKPLLEHVEQNLDPAVPLIAPDGWRASLRQAVYDCWDRAFSPQDGPGERTYTCFDAGAKLPTRMHDIAWVLVRHEWADFQGSADPAHKRAAAWRLDQAIMEYKTLVSGAEQRSVEAQSTSLKRLRVIRGYEAEITASLGGPEASGTARRLQVRDEINRQLALDGSGSLGLDHNVLQDIVGPIQALTRDAMATYLEAVEAELDAKALAVLVYGQGRAETGINPRNYLQCGDADGTGLCAPGSERAVLSLSELAKDRDLRQLYSFVRDAVLDRPNAVGLAERYGRMKAELYFGAPGDAAKAYAGRLAVRWDGVPLSLEALRREAEVINLPPGTSATLAGACAAWAEQIEDAGAPCPFRALIARALPTDAAVDVFGLKAREAALLGLLERVHANSGDKALRSLIEDLMAETGAVFDGNGLVSGPDFVLPYLLAPQPPYLAGYSDALCTSNPGAVFQANFCPGAGTEIRSGPLSDQLRRLINETTPPSRFAAKRLGLDKLLAEMAGEALIADGTLRLSEGGAPGAGSFVGYLCQESSAIFAAMKAAGLRDVRLVPSPRSKGGARLCQ
ncbi:hypothetical protein RA19_13595 [Leisingera sp. ANG-M1]|uniref:hypothetical protein n=1 Tax=Leisingera sp. ANG-M1 TaxID=1577895 RepID=UPI00057DA775|nr:hypothetical protein [Leisingera sp. ANG-M1]KIC09804.1 hypothetical protein RA19_13595 [Leisingera sp. ANG-M1]